MTSAQRFCGISWSLLMLKRFNIDGGPTTSGAVAAGGVIEEKKRKV
ncbi:MAG TPA: hypothetical protein VFH95_13885 [Candidatus Kapabacteria bacterium]|nr:hypothetical protein [Candidatus Kapabacteria bacterium]